MLPLLITLSNQLCFQMKELCFCMTMLFICEEITHWYPKVLCHMNYHMPCHDKYSWMSFVRYVSTISWYPVITLHSSCTILSPGQGADDSADSRSSHQPWQILLLNDLTFISQHDYSLKSSTSHHLNLHISVQEKLFQKFQKHKPRLKNQTKQIRM